METSEDEWEDVAEQLVLIEISGVIDSEFLFKCNPSHCRLLGVETDEPVLQIGSYTFVGRYNNAFGTHVVFEETEVDGAKKLRYLCNTIKTLEMSRAFLKKKEAKVPSTDDS